MGEKWNAAKIREDGIPAAVVQKLFMGNQCWRE